MFLEKNSFAIAIGNLFMANAIHNFTSWGTAQLSFWFQFQFLFLVECRVSYGYDGYFQRISFKQKFKCFRGTDMPLAYHFLAYSYYKHIRRQRNHKTEAKLRHTEEKRREERRRRKRRVL